MSVKTWSTFSKLKNGSEIKFKIEEVSTVKYEDAVELFMRDFVHEEPIIVASGIPANASALAEYKQNMMHMLLSEEHQVDVCYVDDGSNKRQLAGASIMHLTRKSDPELDLSQYNVKTTQGENFMKMVMALESAYNVFEEHKLDSYFYGRGLVVSSEYRCLGIAGELLKAREEACKEYKVPATAAWMTAFGTQKAAAKLGWESVKVLNYAVLGKEAGVSFPCGPTTGKLMLAKFLCK